MHRVQVIKGFSKLSKEDKLKQVTSYFENPKEAENILKSFWHSNEKLQRVMDEFSENTVSNFYFPFGIAPNFLINGNLYLVPMVIEESSVVAAASSSAKFWSEHGGFHAEVISTTKIGQVHFIWKGKKEKLNYLFPELKELLIQNSKGITANMEKRGGGITDIELIDMTEKIDEYFQLKISFDTIDSMGANFINSILEEFVLTLKTFLSEREELEGSEKHCEIIMAILSNYTPDCLVNVYVEADIEAFHNCDDNMSAQQFVWKFQKAVEIAHADPHRAATHNKGIFNGIDAVALATGNDFRAIEAGAHTYAARNGHYTSLSDIEMSNDTFKYSLNIPLAMGTVGGLTALHPLAKFSLELLNNPDAKQLMKIAAAVGLANNFGAIKSLVTKGIQIGHMKMHLFNILNHIGVSPVEKEKAIEFFKDKKVSFSEVNELVSSLRTD